MNKPLILVTGATGKTGQRVVQELIGRGFPVRALARVHDELHEREHPGLVGCLAEQAPRGKPPDDPLCLCLQHARLVQPRLEQSRPLVEVREREEPLAVGRHHVPSLAVDRDDDAAQRSTEEIDQPPFQRPGAPAVKFHVLRRVTAAERHRALVRHPAREPRRQHDPALALDLDFEGPARA